MQDQLSYIVVDNPSQLLDSPEAWSWFREILRFRDEEMSGLWPGLNWVNGADIHCTHCVVLYEGRIAGMMRIIDPRCHSDYYTQSPVFESLAHQEDSVLARAISNNLIHQIEANPGRLAEFGQLVIAKDFRGTRLGLKTQVRRRVNALTVRTAVQLGFNGMFALSREEVNTIKVFSDFGTRFLGEPDRIIYKNNTVSRVILCDQFIPEFMKFVAEIEDEVSQNLSVFSKRSSPSTLSVRTPSRNEDLST